MSFRVSDGIGSGDAGQVDALVRAHGAADDHLAARAPALDLLDAQPHGAVVDQDVVARLQHRAEHRRRDRQVVPCGAVLAGDRDVLAALELDRPVARSPMRSFGPCRSAMSATGRPARSCGSRMSCAVSA